MQTYDPLLTGALNLYNGTLGVLAAVGLVAVASLVVRSGPRAAWRASGGSRTGILSSCLPLGIGAVAFVVLAVAHPVDGVPDWGPFYLLPAAFLAAVTLLAVVRPTEAGVVLAVAAAVAFLSQVALGVTAGRIDPGWIRDGLDKGSLVLMTAVFSLPAMVTAAVLLTRGGPAFVAPGHRGGPAHTRVDRG